MYNQLYNILIIFYFPVNVASGNGIVLNIVFQLWSKNLRKLLIEVMSLGLS